MIYADRGICGWTNCLMRAIAAAFIASRNKASSGRMLVSRAVERSIFKARHAQARIGLLLLAAHDLHFLIGKV